MENSNKRSVPFKKKNRYTVKKKEPQSQEHSKKELPSEWHERVPQEVIVFAQCYVCQTGISNSSYAIKIAEDQFVHFECVLKKVKEIGHKNFSHGNQMQYSYIGSNTFAIYLKTGGSNYSWKILQKIKLDELIPYLKPKAS